MLYCCVDDEQRVRTLYYTPRLLYFVNQSHSTWTAWTPYSVTATSNYRLLLILFISLIYCYYTLLLPLRLLHPVLAWNRLHGEVWVRSTLRWGSTEKDKAGSLPLQCWSAISRCCRKLSTQNRRCCLLYRQFQ